MERNNRDVIHQPQDDDQMVLLYQVGEYVVAYLYLKAPSVCVGLFLCANKPNTILF